MAGGNFHVFLSAVSSEFEQARSHVASDLRSRGLEVKEQEDFRQEAEARTTLQKLHDYIQGCSAVICIVGERAGAVPPQPAAQPFVEMGILPEELSQASYTQWELLFARHYKKRLSLYVAEPGYKPDKPPPSGGDDAELQRQFVAYLMGQGLDYTPFSTVDELCRRVLREDWPRPQGTHVVVRRIAAVVLIGLLAFAAAFWRRDTARPLSGTVDVLVWSPKDIGRRGKSLADQETLPLHNADQIRVQAALNRPAYAYLIWIDSQGVASPVYPWAPGDWEKLPQRLKPIGNLQLPEAADQGWPIDGASGMETLMLLARDTPLPADVKLRDLLSDLPPQSMQTNRSLAWFNDGELVSSQLDTTRGPRFFEPQAIDDPVLRTQRLLQQRLGKYFTTIRAVSFAHAGN